MLYKGNRKTEKRKEKNRVSKEVNVAIKTIVTRISRHMFNEDDLVMCTAKQMQHPAYEYHYIGVSYLWGGDEEYRVGIVPS